MANVFVATLFVIR